jgi:hypothetical protein
MNRPVKPHSAAESNYTRGGCRSVSVWKDYGVVKFISNSMEIAIPEIMGSAIVYI